MTDQIGSQKSRLSDKQDLRLTPYVPVHNNAPHLQDCFDSILEQDVKGAELIILDDASTDDSVSIIKKYIPLLSKRWAVRLIHYVENRGLPALIERSIKESKFDLIMRLDGDDWLAPDAISALQQNLAVHRIAVWFTEIILNITKMIARYVK